VSLSADDAAALAAAAGAGAVKLDEPMARHTTLRVGGPADAWVEPADVPALQAVVRTARQRGLPVRAVGAGSNLLVKDGGLRGVTLSTRRLRGLERVDETGVRVEAGVTTGKLLLACTQWELGGVEFLGGVPGSVGGGLIMNAGTYLGEFVNVTTHVDSVRFADGELVTRTAAACNFRYRASDLPADEVVVAGLLGLRPRPRAEIEAVVRDLRDRRKEREPAGVDNAGSFFKNPTGDYAGRLIEAAGMKGKRVGGAFVSPKHANWLVQEGEARAADFLALIDLVRSEVERVHGVRLELEVKVIGED
jgi:UDP-N-acetylmuramate dehydrogenase